MLWGILFLVCAVSFAAVMIFEKRTVYSGFLLLLSLVLSGVFLISLAGTSPEYFTEHPLLHLLLVEQTEMPYPAVGEFVDDRATEEVTGNVVDAGTHIGSQRSEKDDKQNVEMSARRMIGGRGNDQLGRNGHNRALEQHQQEYGGVGEVAQKGSNPIHIVGWFLAYE